MNNNYKYLVWSANAVLVALFIYIIAITNQTLNTATTTNTISFNGEGKVSAIPNIAEVGFSIVTEAATSKAAQDSNSAKSQKIVNFLKQQSVSDKDVKTSGYNVYPQYSNTYKPCPVIENSGVQTMMAPAYPCDTGTQKITGYQVTQSFDIKVRDLNNVGSILDGLVAQGANQVNNLGFQIENQEQLKDRARQMAIQDADQKAKTLQSQLNIRLGKVINFSESGNGYPYPYMLEAKTMGSRDSTAPSVPTGENEITVDVTVTYQIR